MAHVLFVVPRFHTNLFFATRALIGAGHRVTVLAASQSAAMEDHSVVVPQVMGESPARDAVCRVLEADRPDLVLLRTSGALSRQVAQVSRRLRLRVVGYDQRPMTEPRSLRRRLSLWLQGRPWQRVTPVPGVDAAAPQDQAASYLPWPTAALPLPTGAERDQSDMPVRVLCVGKLAQVRKNQPLLIAALAALGGGDRVRLTLVGSTSRAISGADADHHAVLQQAARENDWIDIRGDVPFAEMPALYAAHHICVLPSVGEPLGSAPVEAMAYGTIPVISLDTGSVGYVTDGVDGLRVDVTVPGALETALAPLLASPELRVRLSDAARRTAETELSPARFVQRIDALLATSAAPGA
ncbi:glycosyltransferase family 4 protein [Puniceibacterium confluentis]|uniref:glycosyltransferase family 4 protein n=1 Tax=Puniceibacterium confluentis TaxID=1958944 RepID=UPI0011B4E8B1|nr:glycosyltransferase family 4 protein [Puniceibacterium confluentis]